MTHVTIATPDTNLANNPPGSLGEQEFMSKNFELRPKMDAQMQFLLKDYPREAWPDHPNFAQSIQHWMGAHNMFRQLSEIAVGETQLFLDKDRSANDYARRISRYGGMMVQNLLGHHNWEDRSFFPELSTADNRFDAGMDVLENDHHDLDSVLERFVLQANRTIKLIDLNDEKKAYEEAGRLLPIAGEIGSLLDRHLSDEEDLVVPILLHHKLRG